MLLSLLFVSMTAQAGLITNSAHDLSSTSTYVGGVKGTNGQICIYCHTPHNAVSNDVPLWNKTFTSASFTFYSSATMNAAKGASVTLQPYSRACLTCHDGSLNADAYAYAWSTGGSSSGTTKVNGNDLLGTDLRNDHPISVLYSADTTLKAAPAGYTFSGYVECASCHMVHDPGLTSNGTAPFLRSTNNGSALCLMCHNK